MKVKIGNLPEGFKIVNGKVVRSMKTGGTVNNTLGPMKREDANLEAEKGETTLTDLTNDGSFELYNIGGKRHYEGGTPLNLPEQSFVFSDTSKMKLTIDELKQLGISSKKKMTPAKASKNFPLNKYIEILENPDSDKIAVHTAEDMLNKNKIKLSQIAFLQEQKKKFADGVPLAAYPYMLENGINPQEFEAKVQQQNMPTHTMPDGTVHPGATHEEYMAMQNQGALQQFTGGPSMNMGGSPDIAKAIQAQSNPMGAAMNAIKDGTAQNSMNAWLSGDMEGWANAGPMKYGGNLPKFGDTGETKKERKKRIKNYEHPNFDEYVDLFSKRGDIANEDVIKDIMSKMNVTDSDTLFVDNSMNRNVVNTKNSMQRDAYIASVLGTNDLSYDDKMPFYSSTPDEDGVSWDFMKNLYRSDGGNYTQVQKVTKPQKFGGSPFEEHPLKRFTDGGTPQAEMLGMASQQGRLSDSQIALQNIMMYRQQLLEEYESTSAYVKDNPNVLADPEKAKELEASIRMMETQLQEIDMQTQVIQRSMLNQSLQVNPFEGMQGVEPEQPMAKYGTELPKFQTTGELTGSDAWGYQGDDEEGNPIIGMSEPMQETYDPKIAKGYNAHQQAFNIMASKDFDGVRQLWLDKYREAAANNKTGKYKWISEKEDGTPYSDAELFHIFNRMNQYLSAVNAGEGSGDIFGKDASGNTDALAKKYGYGDKAPTKEEIKIFQGMYTSLNNAKIADESGLLDQIATTPIGKAQTYTEDDIKALKANNKWTNQKVGDPKMIDADGNNVSFVDGALGWTTGGQHYRAENPTETTNITTVTETDCDAETRARIMQECLEKGLGFNQEKCECKAEPEIPGTAKTPKYETFPQDDLIVATKAAQLAGLKQFNPVLEPSIDPTLVNPMYVDPRQQLSVIEATAAEAIRQNPDQATAIMGKMQDASEGVINKHENLNTKIYNNAMAINVPLINDAAESNAKKFKTFMDEVTASNENFQVAQMEMTDNLVNAVNDQMSNADQQYLENLKNPQFWYSPQAHNIEYYNEKDITDPNTGEPLSDSMIAYNEYKALADKDKEFADKYFDKIYKPKKKEDNDVNITRNNASETAKFGKETSRKRDLLRSKRELRKWILGYK